MQPTQLNVTELDFDKIKANLKQHFSRAESEFSDWNFEGSGLSLLLDVLAYNTHYNAVLAHTSLNESFIDSAQIRANVVSRGKLLGYVPRSVTAARAKVSVVFTRSALGISEGVVEVSLPVGTTFTAPLDGIVKTFVTLDEYTAELDTDANTFTFPAVDLYQGQIKTESFFTAAASSEQKYVIQNPNIDTTTLQVRVFGSITSTSYEAYSRFISFAGADSTSTLYFLSENHEGKYEVRFGDGVIGKKPSAQNLVQMFFIASDGPKSNGASTFTLTSTVPYTTSTVTSTIQAAYNGSEREGIESIRFNAPNLFTAQNRAVTAEDYRVLVNQI